VFTIMLSEGLNGLIDQLDHVPHRQEDAECEHQHHAAHRNHQDGFQRRTEIVEVVIHFAFVMFGDLVQEFRQGTGFLAQRDHLQYQGREQAGGMCRLPERFSALDAVA